MKYRTLDEHDVRRYLTCFEGLLTEEVDAARAEAPLVTAELNPGRDRRRRDRTRRYLQEG